MRQRLKGFWIQVLFIAILAISAGSLMELSFTRQTGEVVGTFSGERALKDIEKQLAFGPRTPGSESHQETVNYIQQVLKSAGWQTEIQRKELANKYILQNIIAKRNDRKPRWLIGAHYDTRFIADQETDLELKNKPVPGANDGASGVAILLELARSLPKEASDPELVFFDAEDQGRIADWDWIYGSKVFVEAMEEKPEAVIIIDMVGDKDLHLYKEMFSDELLTQRIWDTAAACGYSQFFIDEKKHAMLDDHRPFIDAGIPTSLIIDFDYPAWHTTGDTLDRVSAQSLMIVGDTLTRWIQDQSAEKAE